MRTPLRLPPAPSAVPVQAAGVRSCAASASAFGAVSSVIAASTASRPGAPATAASLSAACASTVLVSKCACAGCEDGGARAVKNALLAAASLLLLAPKRTDWSRLSRDCCRVQSARSVSGDADSAPSDACDTAGAQRERQRRGEETGTVTLWELRSGSCTHDSEYGANFEIGEKSISKHEGRGEPAESEHARTASATLYGHLAKRRGKTARWLQKAAESARVIATPCAIARNQSIFVRSLGAFAPPLSPLEPPARLRWRRRPLRQARVRAAQSEGAAACRAPRATTLWGWCRRPSTCRRARAPSPVAAVDGRCRHNRYRHHRRQGSRRLATAPQRRQLRPESALLRRWPRRPRAARNELDEHRARVARQLRGELVVLQEHAPELVLSRVGSRQPALLTPERLLHRRLADRRHRRRALRRCLCAEALSQLAHLALCRFTFAVLRFGAIM
eukprot:5086908-Pleurochrysis_carterae.AAC.2